MEQLDLFEESNPKTFAVIFCSCIMKDQFGVIWERQEIIKTDLTKEAADKLARQKNGEICTASYEYPGKLDYYKVVEMESVNFLVA